MGVHLEHRTFTILRDLPGSPSHAFRFWAEHDLKRLWTSCHPTWSVLQDDFDFRLGGSERVRWRMPDGIEQGFVAHFLEIAPGDRLIYAYAMTTDHVPISSSLVTVELVPQGGTTRMTMTEQAAFATVAIADQRENGTGIGFDRLVAILAAEA